LFERSRRPVQEAVRIVVRPEQLLDPPAQGGVAGTGIVQESGALAGRLLPRAVE
jgi:hypothetical protein